MSNYRLITQNLLASAAQAVSGEPTRTAVEDLASLINTAVLYDGLVVLGSPDVWSEYAKQSPLIASLMAASLLEVRELDSGTIRSVVQLSRLHLASATKVKDLPAIERFLEAAYLERLCYPVLNMQPDGAVDLAAGREWIATAPNGRDLDALIREDLQYARSAFFYVRTFFYTAYMDLAGIDFTADRIRATVLNEISRRQFSLQNELLTKLRVAFSEGLFIEELSGWLSPFAAVVFRRSKGTRNRIPDEIIGLREEIANARRELLDLQAGFRYGPTNSQTATLQITGANNHSSLAEAQAAFRNYVSARDQLLLTFGPTGQEVQTKGILAFAANTFMAALDPKNPEKWLKVVGSTPLENLARPLAIRRFAEIHKLRDDLPASGELFRTIEDLFGRNALHRDPHEATSHSS